MNIFYSELAAALEAHFPERPSTPPEPEPLSDEARCEISADLVLGKLPAWLERFDKDDLTEIAWAVQEALEQRLPHTQAWDHVIRKVLAHAENAAEKA